MVPDQGLCENREAVRPQRQVPEPVPHQMSDSRIGASAFRFDTALLILIMLDRETIAGRLRCVHVAAEGIPG